MWIGDRDKVRLGDSIGDWGSRYPVRARVCAESVVEMKVVVSGTVSFRSM